MTYNHLGTAHRIRLFEKHRECQECGFSEHPEILVIHHIDGNRRNNDDSNLIILCPNCHALKHYKRKRTRKDVNAYHRDYYARKKVNNKQCTSGSSLKICLYRDPADYYLSHPYPKKPQEKME